MASTESTVPPPMQHLPTSKERKYDRQLRLWAASGQQALEDAHILLINSGPGVTGIETLKNLVLPGIGQFTIQDSAVVNEADLGVNFFLEENSINQFRASETCKLLKELNPDVKGNSITEVSLKADPSRNRCADLIYSHYPRGSLAPTCSNHIPSSWSHHQSRETFSDR